MNSHTSSGTETTFKIPKGTKTVFIDQPLCEDGKVIVLMDDGGIESSGYLAKASPVNAIRETSHERNSDG